MVASATRRKATGSAALSDAGSMRRLSFTTSMTVPPKPCRLASSTRKSRRRRCLREKPHDCGHGEHHGIEDHHPDAHRRRDGDAGRRAVAELGSRLPVGPSDALRQAIRGRGLHGAADRPRRPGEGLDALKVCRELKLHKPDEPPGIDRGTTTMDRPQNAGLTQRRDMTTIVGTSANNTLTGGAARDLIYGRDGNDTLYGLGSGDYLSGENGNDILYGGDGDDQLDGGAGADVLRGDAGNDYLNGMDGGDTLESGAGRDTLRADAGNDLLRLTGDGQKLVNGGEGDDTIQVYARAMHTATDFSSVLSGDGGFDTMRFGGQAYVDGEAVRTTVISQPANDPDSYTL